MTLECLNTILCDQGAIRAVRFNVNGHYCMTCGSDKKIKLWNPYLKTLLKTYGGHSDDVADVAGSCDSSQIVSGSRDKSVILWDVLTGQALRRLRGHAAGVTCIAFNEDSSVSVSGSTDNTVCCWDMRSRNTAPIQVLSDAKDGITSVKVTSHEILTSSIDCFTRQYDLRNGKLITDFVGDPITCLNYSKDGQCILVSCANSTVKLMEKLSGELLCEYSGHRTEDVAIESAVNNNDTMVISGSISGEIFFWDLVKGDVKFILVHIYGKAVNSLTVHPQKEILVSASVGSIKMWGEKVFNLEDEEPI